MNGNKYQAVLFDFHGVLCHDHFYESIFLPERQDIYEWIMEKIFGDKVLMKKWMRGEVSSEDINRSIAEAAGMEPSDLNQQFNESIRSMQLDERLVNLVKTLAERGVKTGIVTDNMDVFSSITVPNHKLSDLFHVIINSSDHGLLKQDDEGKLFDKALETIGVNIDKALHIDDSFNNAALFKKKGGDVFLYNNFEELTKFLDL